MDRDYDEIRGMADHLRQYEKTILLLAVSDKGKIRLICTRSADLVRIDCAVLLKQVLSEIEGQGGGKPEFAQGGAPLPGKEKNFADFMKSALDHV